MSLKRSALMTCPLLVSNFRHVSSPGWRKWPSWWRRLYLLHYGGKNWPWRWRTTAISANCWSCSECARTWRTEKACITSMTSSKAFSSSTAQRSSKSCSPKNASWMWSDVWSSILRYPNHGGIEEFLTTTARFLKRSFPFQTRSCGRRFTRTYRVQYIQDMVAAHPLCLWRKHALHPALLHLLQQVEIVGMLQVGFRYSTMYKWPAVTLHIGGQVEMLFRG